MISYGQQSSIFTDLTQNSSATNITRGQYLMNIEQRYLLQKYFANEGSYQIQTIGQTSFTLSAAVPIVSTSCTLLAAWPYQTTQAQLTFSDGEVVLGNFTSGSTTVTWLPAIPGTIFYTTNSIATGATSATLATAWAAASGSYLVSFSDGSTKTVTFTQNATTMTWTGGLAEGVLGQFYTSTILANSSASIGGVQFYPFPPNYSKLKDITITVGVLRWTLTEVRTREEWDNLNVFPYYASIPAKFFIYPGGDKGGQIGIWPIPSTTGNVITYNYKFRVPDLSIADYNTDTNNGTVNGAGTISVNNGSMAVTGSGTAFVPTSNAQLESRWLRIPQPSGDNLWYQIANISSTTAITLYQPYQGINVSGATYTVAQMPLIAEDFQDILVWRALQQYYMSIVDGATRVKEYKEIYEEKLQQLEAYSGSNTVNVNISPTRASRGNPNAFVQKVGRIP